MLHISFSHSFRYWRYLSAFSVPAIALIGFQLKGVWMLLPLAYVFGLIPLLELLLSPQRSNLSEQQEKALLQDRRFDWILYAVLPVQYGCLACYLLYVCPYLLHQGSTLEYIGGISSMGILCGVYGINVAHELGHRSKSSEQYMAQALLLTSLYMHFFIEHNRGHHKHIATDQDPASARQGENLYQFWLRSLWGALRSAWKLENKRLKGRSYSIHNQLLQFLLIEVIALVLLTYLLGTGTLLCFVSAALTGILLLETVNYIEHYGLRRKQLASGQYERVMPCHSWNSDHLLGRLLLFELSRHSDHHYLASRKYQILRHHERSPQMPTGYPGMMLLALLPPLWFYLMNSEIKRFAYLSL